MVYKNLSLLKFVSMVSVVCMINSFTDNNSGLSLHYKARQTPFSTSVFIVVGQTSTQVLVSKFKNLPKKQTSQANELVQLSHPGEQLQTSGLGEEAQSG